MRPALFLLALSACDMGHLGTPLTLPVSGVTTMFENAAYGARRGEVSAFLAAHGPAVVAGDDPARREELFAIAGTPDAQMDKVVREIKDLPDGPEWVEQATIIVMVHS